MDKYTWIDITICIDMQITTAACNTSSHKLCIILEIHQGMKAPQTAGVIHSDFERGFIRAETVSFADLDQYGSMQAVKEAGRLRLEGKEYMVEDGDIIEFRFNV